MPFAPLLDAFRSAFDLLPAVTHRRRDLTVDVVVLRQRVRMYRCQATRSSALTGHASRRNGRVRARSGRRTAGISSSPQRAAAP
jgi:hypothetical protein